MRRGDGKHGRTDVATLRNRSSKMFKKRTKESILRHNNRSINERNAEKVLRLRLPQASPTASRVPARSAAPAPKTARNHKRCNKIALISYEMER